MVLLGVRTQCASGDRAALAIPGAGQACAGRTRPSGVPGSPNLQPAYCAHHWSSLVVGEATRPALGSRFVKAGRTLRRNAQGRAIAPGIPSEPIRPDRVELAWAAGFFDGEGSTFVVQRSQYVAIGISQSDRDGRPAVLTRFKCAVGGIGTIGGPFHVRTPAGEDAEPKWIYNAFGHEMAQAVIAQIWPWLGSAKRDQACRALKAHREHRGWKPRSPGTTFGRPPQQTCKRGHDLTFAQQYPEHPGRSRECKDCRHARYVERRDAC